MEGSTVLVDPLPIYTQYRVVSLAANIHSCYVTHTVINQLPIHCLYIYIY